MASVSVPEEAASHLGAILLAFNREIFGGFLDEADELAGLGHAASAVLVAGTILEYFEKSPLASVLTTGSRGEIAAWRQLRNQVAHGSAPALTVEQARQLIDGIRRILTTGGVPERPVHHRAQESVSTPGLIKGKYAHVAASSDDFIKRKRKELELEDRE